MDSDCGSPDSSAVGGERGHSIGVGSASVHTGITAPSPSSPVPPPSEEQQQQQPRSPSPEAGHHRRSQTQRVRDLLSSIDGMVMESELEDPEDSATTVHLPVVSPDNNSGLSVRYRSGSAAGDSGDARSARSGRSVRSVRSNAGRLGTLDGGGGAGRSSLRTPPDRYGLESDGDEEDDDVRSPERRAFFPYAAGAAASGSAVDPEDRVASVLPPAGEDGTASSDMLLAEVDWLIAGTNAALGGDENEPLGGDENEPNSSSGLDMTPDKREVVSSPKMSGVLLESSMGGGGGGEAEEDGGGRTKLAAGGDGDDGHGLLRDISLGGSSDSAARNDDDDDGGDNDDDEGEDGSSHRRNGGGGAGSDLKRSLALPSTSPSEAVGPSGTNVAVAGAAMTMALPSEMVAEEGTLAGGARADDAGTAPADVAAATATTPSVSVLEAAGFAEATVDPTKEERERGVVSSEGGGDDGEGMSTVSAGDRDEARAFVPPPQSSLPLVSGVEGPTGTVEDAPRKDVADEDEGEEEEEEAGGGGVPASSSVDNRDGSTERIVVVRERAEVQNAAVVVHGDGEEGALAADSEAEAGAGAGEKAAAAVLHPDCNTNGDGVVVLSSLSSGARSKGGEKKGVVGAVDVTAPRTGGAEKENNGVRAGGRRGNGEAAKTKTTAVGAVEETTAVRSGARPDRENVGMFSVTRGGSEGATAAAGGAGGAVREARKFKPVGSAESARQVAAMVMSDSEEEEGVVVAHRGNGGGHVPHVPQSSFGAKEAHSAEYEAGLALGAAIPREEEEEEGRLGLVARSSLSAVETTRPVDGVSVNGKGGGGLGGLGGGGDDLMTVVDGAQVEHGTFEDVEL